MDLDRLNQIAEILEISLVDLINSDEGIYVNEVKTNQGGFNTNSEIIINVASDVEKDLYEKLIMEKDKALADKDKEIEFLRSMLQSKTS